MTVNKKNKKRARVASFQEVTQDIARKRAALEEGRCRLYHEIQLAVDRLVDCGDTEAEAWRQIMHYLVQAAYFRSKNAGYDLDQMVKEAKHMIDQCDDDSGNGYIN